MKVELDYGELCWVTHVLRLKIANSAEDVVSIPYIKLMVELLERLEKIKLEGERSQNENN